jgi:hypothetical protein
MSGFLGSPWTQIALVPFILMIIGVLARRLGRADGDPTPRRNDWAVGTTLLLMALGTILGDLRDEPSATVSLLFWLLGVLVAVFVSLDYDRFKSWGRDPAGLPTKEKRIFVRIILPDMICFGIFAAYQAHKVHML